LGKVENPFQKDDAVEVEIDDIGSLKGSVVRSTSDAIAIAMAAFNDLPKIEEV